MATGTQLVKIHKTSDNSVVYTCTTPRNTATDPLTTEGNAAFAAKAQHGELRLVVDNGAIIPVGTIPPLIKPDAPTSGSVPAFSQKIQAEVSSTTGTYTGLVGDGTSVGPLSNSAQYCLFGITGAPITASNYALDIRYTTNFDTGTTGETGICRVIINSGTPIDFVTDGAAGGFRTKSLTNISLNEGNNTIRVEGNFRTMFLDYISVSRAASS